MGTEHITAKELVQFDIAINGPRSALFGTFGADEHTIGQGVKQVSQIALLAFHQFHLDEKIHLSSHTQVDMDFIDEDYSEIEGTYEEETLTRVVHELPLHGTAVILNHYEACSRNKVG